MSDGSLLTKKAMVVSLSISKFGISKKDKIVSADVAERYNTDEKAGNYNKRILPKHAVIRINEMASRMRAFHNASTLPWNDDGQRLLASKNYETYNETMREYEAEFNKAVNSFIDNYDTYKNDAMEMLGEMFNPDDYDDKDKIKGKFGVKFSYYPVPAIKDFRVDVSTEDMAALQAQLENDINAKYEHSIKSAWYKVNDYIMSLIGKLEDQDKTIKSSSIDKIREILPVLKTFNFEDDERYNEIIDSINEKVCQFTAKELNTDVGKCSQVVKDAKRIVTSIGDYADFFSTGKKD